MLTLSRLIRYLILLLITCILTLTWPSLVMGQLPFLPTSNGEDQTTETQLWNLNRAEPCGKFWCSNVYLYKDDNFGIPTLTLAIKPNPDQSAANTALNIEQRAALVRRTFEKIAKDIIKAKPPIPVSHPNNLWFWWYFHPKSPHPWTPKVEVGVENDQTVVYVPAQPELGLASQVLVTVTETDAEANGMSVKELGQQWKTKIQESYSSFLWGYELNQIRPALRFIIGGLIVGITLFLLWLLHLASKPLRQWKVRLRGESKKLTRSLAVNAEAKANPQPTDRVIDSEHLPEDSTQEGELSAQPSDNDISRRPPIPSLLGSVKRGVKNIVQQTPAWDLSQQILKKQSLIEQKRNISHFLLSLIFLAQFFVILFGLGLISLSFRTTRFLIDFFFREAAWIPIVWIGVSLINQILDFVIDAVLNRWATEGQKLHPDSNRYTLRANTYSKAYKSAKTVLLTAIGVYLTILIIGINPSVLAGAGAVAVVVAFLSRNVLEDMLNGALILWTDRYAIGDVIIVPDIGDGGVEDMNLYTTSLRNLDGQLTVIPNGKISAVKNLSKNWAQVNFTIKVAWDANLHKTMEILQQVLDQLQNDPQWADKILEQGEVLGIDEVSHEGILIRTVIKTKPLQQWAIGREFRIRLKEAFDRAGISLGVPQREISIVHNNGNSVTSDQ